MSIDQKNNSEFIGKKRFKVSTWLKLFEVLNLKEKFFFSFLFLVFLGSSLGWGFSYYYSKTEPIPDYGEEYVEGIVGQPLNINPIISQSNKTDDELARLVYSGILKYDGKGNLIPDLAERYEVSEDKKTFTIYLKKNVLWHDENQFDSEDVIFTINLLSNPSYKSPLRLNWQGIETNAIDSHTIEFKIKSPYVGFLNNLTFGILPKHLWESITPENFSLNSLNLNPIGTGPFKFSSIQKDSKGNILSYKLTANPGYFEGKPYLSKISFNFYADEESALDALNKKEIMGMDSLSPEKISDIKIQKSIFVHKFEIPRYSGVFFNKTKSVPLSFDEVREALNLATNRQEIIDSVLYGNGQAVSLPFFPGMVGYSEELSNFEFNLEKAEKILEDNNWKKDSEGFRKKDDTLLEINLVTIDWEELVKTAEIIKEQWAKIGIKVNVNSFSISDVRENHIRTREYDAILFGQVIGADPDPYYFWHSDNKKDPGHNLALFGNEESDKLIENGRTEFDQEKRKEIYNEFQKIFIKENPAVLLYRPNYIYPMAKKVQGVDIETLLSPAKRFSETDKWYIKTKRIKK